MPEIVESQRQVTTHPDRPISNHPLSLGELIHQRNIRPDVGEAPENPLLITSQNSPSPIYERRWEHFGSELIFKRGKASLVLRRYENDPSEMDFAFDAETFKRIKDGLAIARRIASEQGKSLKDVSAPVILLGTEPLLAKGSWGNVQWQQEAGAYRINGELLEKIVAGVEDIQRGNQGAEFKAAIEGIIGITPETRKAQDERRIATTLEELQKMQVLAGQKDQPATPILNPTDEKQAVATETKPKSRIEDFFVRTEAVLDTGLKKIASFLEKYETGRKILKFAKEADKKITGFATELAESGAIIVKNLKEYFSPLQVARPQTQERTRSQTQPRQERRRENAARAEQRPRQEQAAQERPVTTAPKTPQAPRREEARRQPAQENPVAEAARPQRRQEDLRPAQRVEHQRREPPVSTPIENPDGRVFWTGAINPRAEGVSSVKGGREQNEDAIILAKYSNGRAVAGVFDGMGGQAAGEVASQQAAYRLWEKLHQEYVTLTGLARDAISQAHLDIKNYNMQRGGESAGTTATTATTTREKIRIDHVGDSRALLIRGNGVYRLTNDHTLVAEQLAAGIITEEEARRSENRSVLTNAVGPIDSARSFHIESNTYQWVPGDVLMLHSDGLSGLTNEQIAYVINRNRGNLQKAASELNALAIRYGSSDNCSVVLIENPR